MDAVASVRFSGPLTCHVEGLAADLRSQGYTELSLRNQLRLAADLSRWLESKKHSIKDLDGEILGAFICKRQRSHTHFTSRRALAPLLCYLRSVDLISVEEVPEPRRRRGVLCEYERYLVEERDVSTYVREFYLAVAEEFLVGRKVTQLRSSDVAHFVRANADRSNLPGRLSALRSWLRFLFVSSKTASNLLYAVPSTPQWSQTSLPRALEPAQLDAVLATPDRRTRAGCRAYAVLLLLSRLGLRAGEVAALQIEDLDWKSGEITIRGKGKSIGKLPLPVDVGEAIVAWLQRGRRHVATRALFVRSRAPYCAIRSSGVVGIATTALRAVGIASGGAHRLRHTAATQMLRRGATLTEIAQVLRHRHINTTAIYAKVDEEALRTVAKPWPTDEVARHKLRTLVRQWPGGVA